MSERDDERRRALLLALEERMRALGLGPEVGRRIVRAFLVQAPRYIDELARWGAGDETPEVRRALHSLRGAASNLGLESLVDRCASVRASVIHASATPSPSAATRAREDVALLVRESREAIAWIRRWLAALEP